MRTSKRPIPGTPPVAGDRSLRRGATAFARCLAAVIVAASVLASCHSAPPDIIGPKAVRIHAPIHTSGTKIIDSTGAAVRFNGVGIQDYVGVGPPGTECVTTPSRQEVHDIVAWGFNSVRVPLAWVSIEPDAPTPGPDGILTHHWNTDYLTNLDGFVQEMAAHGLAVILTLHNHFGTNTTKPSPCHMTTMPPWLYPQGTSDQRTLKCQFLEGVSQPGAPEPIWDGFAALWAMLAERYASEPLVVGADLVNEPYAVQPCAPSDARLSELYQDVSDAIRAVNPDMAIIFEDAPPHYAEQGDFEVRVAPSVTNAIYSYHMYQPNWDPVGERVNAAYWQRAQAWGVPLLVGEFNAFGYAYPAGSYQSDWRAQTLQALTYWKANGISWIMWAYRGGNHLIEKDGTPRYDLISVFQKGY